MSGATAEPLLLPRFRDHLLGLRVGPLGPDDVRHPRLRLEAHGRLSTHYAPFEHVAPDARLVLVGITPGLVQAAGALAAARDALRAGAEDVEVLRRVKATASLAGPARATLVTMLDDLGLAAPLGAASTAELFAMDGRLHATSALRLPVLRDGRNYAGTGPDPLRDPVLRGRIEQDLAAQLCAVPAALIVPLGRAPAEAVAHLVTRGDVDASRVLAGVPHPSGANAHRPRLFAERRTGLRAAVERWAGGPAS